MTNEDEHDELKARRARRDAEGPRERKSTKAKAESPSAQSGPAENALSQPLTPAQQTLDKHSSTNLQRKFLRRRAVDLIVPSVTAEKVSALTIGDGDVDRLIAELEGGTRTGCVKAFSDDKKWRGALLLFRGRCVGAVYGSEAQPELEQTEAAMQKLLSEMQHPNTELAVYDLSEEILLPMSSLFLGHPIERKDKLSAIDYSEYILPWLKSQRMTACLAVSFPASPSTCMGLVYRGNFVGTFYVEEQTFSRELSVLTKMIAQDSGTHIEANVLTYELGSELTAFGFKLRRD